MVSGWKIRSGSGEDVGGLTEGGRWEWRLERVGCGVCVTAGVSSSLSR